MSWSTAISAGASLLGGMFGKSKSYSPRQMAVGNVEGLMQAADLFKINPLTLLNAGLSPSAMAGQNYMGSAIADAGLALADRMQRKAANDSRIQELEKEKEELQKKVVDLIIRPKVGGIYSGNHMVPSLCQALRVADAESVRSAGGSVAAVGDSVGAADTVSNGLRPLPDQLDSDPRREADNTKQKTHSGFIAVESPYVEYPIYIPTLDGDEQMGLTDISAAAT